MSVTLREVVDDPQLRLIAHASEEMLRRPVTWVHTSELKDPTPFLEGGELLLTTGLDLDTDHDACRGYVDRLVAAGVAGLGFGVEIAHPAIPEALADAASRGGLALLEVPREIPFIAISKSVSRALAAEENAELRRISRSQRELARAASGHGGLAALVGKLATHLRGWALLLDAAGTAVHASHPGKTETGAVFDAELQRLRETRGLAASSFTVGGEEVSLQVLGARARGFLAVGSKNGWTTTDHHVINSAASLLTLALEQHHEVGDARRRVRAATFELLLRGGDRSSGSPLRELASDLPAGALRVLDIVGPDGVESLQDVLERETAGLPNAPFLAAHADGVVALVAVDSPALQHLTSLARSRPGLRVGVSDPCELDSVGEGYRQARDALRHASEAAVFFSELAGHGLLGLVEAADARAFAESLLAPIHDHDRHARGGRGGDLEESLREWLAQHGQWDPAASRLGVHRHTLRNRVRKVEDLLGRSLDDPGLRAELWMALRVLDRGA